MANNGSITPRILLVEDDALMRDSLKVLLSQDYEVEAVVDEAAALAAIQQQVPNLILVDVLMSSLDGLALLQALKTAPQTQEVPVILLSALGETESRIAGLEAGANDYVIKPFSKHDLLTRIKANLSMVRYKQELQTHAQANTLANCGVEANLSNILSCIKDQFLFLDRDWRYTYVNDRVVEVVGLPREQLLGKNIWDLFPDTIGSQFETEVRRSLATQTAVQFEYYYPRLERWFENRVYPAANGVSILVRDISERKRTEAALYQSEERFRQMAETIQDVFWIADFRIPQILYVSPAYEEIWGRSRDSLDHNYADWLDTLHPDDRQRVRTTALMSLDEDIVENEYRIIRPDGSIRWIRDRGFALRDETSQIYQVVGIAQDISQHKQAEAALREAHMQLESALIAGAVYTWRWQIQSDRIIVNAAFAQLFAVDPEQAATEGLPLDMFGRAMHESDRSRVLAQINHAIETGDEYISEYRVHTAAGDERWVVARGRVEYDSAGRAIAFPGALADITERKRAEEDRDRFFQLSRDMLAIVSTDGYFLQVSPAWTETLGYSLEELTAQPYIQFVHPDDQAKTLAEAQKLDQGIETIAFENRYRCRDGSYRWILWSVAPFLEQKTLYCVARDVTERKHTEAQRERLLAREQAAREAAEAANRVKDEFLAVLSHELRTPLNPILGWSKLLQNRKLDEQKTTYALETIERNAKLQVQLIEDLLDIARILRGKLNLTTVPVNLAAIITAALETVRLAADAKSIQIQTLLEPIDQVLGDASRLQQVVWNLVSNAVKFTPPQGRVDIWLERFDEQAQITVSDTGKGIDADFLPHVFEYFRQADNATTRQFGGLGLGLAIVRQIVELHGGTVFAQSQGEGQGATFIVRLPLMQHQQQIQQETQLEPFSGLQGIKVLVVEDIADMREYVTFVLEQSGAEVIAVASVAEALATLTQFLPEVLVSDIGMAEMDGYTLMRQVRMLPSEQGGQIPAIALTAYAADTDYNQALAVGFQTHIAKPVEPATLVAKVAELAKLNESRSD